jgi:hypothetical protein
LEIAFSKKAEQEVIDDAPKSKAAAKRIDIACLEVINGKINLCFWEAKDCANPKLWASGSTPPPVVEQISGYRTLVRIYQANILSSYRLVADNFLSIAKMAGRDGELCPIIKAVAADGKKLVAATPDNIGVVIFGFSKADSKSKRHGSMKNKLEDADLAVCLRGVARGLKLPSAASRSHHG